MDFDHVIERVVVQKGVLPSALHTIPNLTGMLISVSDGLFWDLAEVSRGQRAYDQELARRCCKSERRVFAANRMELSMSSPRSRSNIFEAQLLLAKRKK